MNWLYKKLSVNWVFSGYILFIIVIFNFFGIVISKEIVGDVLGLFSIVIGFLISSITNLFGRDVTKRMKRSTPIPERDQNLLTQLHLFEKEVMSIVFKIVMMIMFSLLVLLMPNNLACIIESSVRFISLKSSFSGLYIGIVIYIVLAIYRYFRVLFNLLFND